MVCQDKASSAAPKIKLLGLSTRRVLVLGNLAKKIGFLSAGAWCMPCLKFKKPRFEVRFFRNSAQAQPVLLINQASAPREAEGRWIWGGLSFGYFSLAIQRKVTRRARRNLC